MFLNTVDTYPDKPLFNYKENNNWIPLTGKDIKLTVSSISFALSYKNIFPKEKVAILSTTSYRWALCDYGIISLGAVTVTVYPTLLPDHIKHIINDSGSKLIFVENVMQLEKVKTVYDDCPHLKYIIVMDNSLEKDEEFILNLNSFLIVPKDFIESSKDSFETMINTAKPEDLLTLIYTSGTTGMPKGVMLSHNNLISNIEGVQEISTINDTDSFLSFLPLSHVLERMAGHFSPFSMGAKIFYAENMETVANDIIEVSPTIVICVPRFFEKIYNKLNTTINTASGFKKKLFNWALKIGKDYTNTTHAGYTPSFLLRLNQKLAEKLIYKKIKLKLGGNIKYFISGGAPLSHNIAEFFAALDVMILEGYGLTETSPVLTASRPDKIKFGSPGLSLNNVEIKIASDGEILAKGPNIMIGYHNMENETKEVFDEEGWLKTGDIGEIDKSGFLKITDRKKSLIVTSAGKNIAPAPLENSLNNSLYINQSMVIGDQKNFISAIIVPSFDDVKQYLLNKGKDISSNQALVEHPVTIELIQNEIDIIMKPFAQFERVKKTILSYREFSIEKGEMTPKMSIVRKFVLKNFKDKIDALYDN